MYEGEVVIKGERNVHAKMCRCASDYRVYMLIYKQNIHGSE